MVEPARLVWCRDHAGCYTSNEVPEVGTYRIERGHRANRLNQPAAWWNSLRRVGTGSFWGVEYPYDHARTLNEAKELCLRHASKLAETGLLDTREVLN